MKRAFFILFLTYLWFNLPTFHDGLFQVFDNIQVTRIQAMYSELTAHQFPVRYLDDFGHGAGYFLFTFYSPIVYYLGALFHGVGFSVIQSVKLVYLLMSGLGVVGMFLLLRSRVSLGSAILASITFLTAPYLYHDFFHRGTLTEAAAFTLVPWVWLTFMRLKEKITGLRVSLAALLFGLLILTHALTGIMVLGTIVLYGLIPPLSLRKVLGYMLTIILGFGVAATTLLPSLFEKSLIRYTDNSFVQSGYLDHPVPLRAQWMNQGAGDTKSAYLGTTLLAGLVILLMTMFRSSSLRKQHKQLLPFILITGIGGLYLMSPISSGIWERIFYLRYFQFPFRLLTIVTSALVLGYGLLLEYFKSSKRMTLVLLLLIIIPLGFSRRYYQPLGYQYGTTYTVDDPCMTTTWADEYLTQWTTACVLSPIPELVTPLTPTVTATLPLITDHGRTIHFTLTGAGEVEVAKYYFPAWQAYDAQGKKLLTMPSGEHGLIEVITTEPATEVTLKLTPTRIERWGDYVTLLSLVLCVGLLLQSLVFFRRAQIIRP